MIQWNCYFQLENCVLRNIFLDKKTPYLFCNIVINCLLFIVILNKMSSEEKLIAILFQNLLY